MELLCRNCSFQQTFQLGQLDGWPTFPAVLTQGVEAFMTGLPLWFVPSMHEPILQRTYVDDWNRFRLIQHYQLHQEELADGWVPYQLDLYHCPTCHRFSNRFWCALFLQLDVVQPLYECPHDQTELERIEISDIDHFPCPSCDGHSLYVCR